MNTITLPAATVAALPSEAGAVVYVAVKGEEQAFPSDRIKHGAWGPPSVLADLNGKTCEGCEWWFHNGEPLGARHPDCAGTGRAPLTIQHEGMVTFGNPPQGAGYGHVTDPRRWTVDGLWPVIEGTPSLADGVEVVIIEHEPPGILLWNDDGCDPITVTGPPPSPGNYVVALTLAASS